MIKLAYTTTTLHQTLLADQPFYLSIFFRPDHTKFPALIKIIRYTKQFFLHVTLKIADKVSQMAGISIFFSSERPEK